MDMRLDWHGYSKVSIAFVLATLTACDVSTSTHAKNETGPGGGAPPPALLHQKMAKTAFSLAKNDWKHIPVPPADGPSLMPVVLAKLVYAQPNKTSEKLGYLRVGEKVARSEAAVSTEDCSGGWYAVRPLGFVCNDKKSTLDQQHPVVRAIQVPPDRTKPMPYDYAFLRSIAPNYLRVPTKDEQFQTEMRLERHLRNYNKLANKWDSYSLGANAVPLSPNGAALSDIPADADIPSYEDRLGGTKSTATAQLIQPPWWLEGRRRIPNFSTFTTAPDELIADRVKRHAGVALIGIFNAGSAAQDRNFSLTVDGRLIPSDKLKAESASAFHGVELAPHSLKLPLGFINRDSVGVYSEKGKRLSAKLNYRKVVELKGSKKKIKGITFWPIGEARWLRERDLKVIIPRGKYPWFAKGNTRWVDVSIHGQSLVLYEGTTPVYATLVSTGRDLLGDPKKSLSTPLGTFRVYQKHVTNTMDSRVADNEFELRDVPWVMYFKGGYALHGAYWHDQFGRARSHGCVNHSPIDARYVFQFVSPDVPGHWHGAYSAEASAQGTIVEIRP